LRGEVVWHRQMRDGVRGEARHTIRSMGSRVGRLQPRVPTPTGCDLSGTVPGPSPGAFAALRLRPLPAKERAGRG
jgi:hypothetical protein